MQFQQRKLSTKSSHNHTHTHTSTHSKVQVRLTPPLIRVSDRESDRVIPLHHSQLQKHRHLSLLYASKTRRLCSLLCYIKATKHQSYTLRPALSVPTPPSQHTHTHWARYHRITPHYSWLLVPAGHWDKKLRSQEHKLAYTAEREQNWMFYRLLIEQDHLINVVFVYRAKIGIITSVQSNGTVSKSSGIICHLLKTIFCPLPLKLFWPTNQSHPLGLYYTLPMKQNMNSLF